MTVISCEDFSGREGDSAACIITRDMVSPGPGAHVPGLARGCDPPPPDDVTPNVIPSEVRGNVTYACGLGLAPAKMWVDTQAELEQNLVVAPGESRESLSIADEPGGEMDPELLALMDASPSKALPRTG